MARLPSRAAPPAASPKGLTAPGPGPRRCHAADMTRQAAIIAPSMRRRDRARGVMNERLDISSSFRSTATLLISTEPVRGRARAELANKAAPSAGVAPGEPRLQRSETDEEFAARRLDEVESPAFHPAVDRQLAAPRST